MEAASGFVSQSQLKSTCFGTLWKSRNGFNNKSGEYFERRCTERETGEGKLVETVMQNLKIQHSVLV